MPGGSLTRGITDVHATGLYRPKGSGGTVAAKGAWELASAASLLNHPQVPWYELLHYYGCCQDDADDTLGVVAKPPNTWRRPQGGLQGTAVARGKHGHMQRCSGNERAARFAREHRRI